MEGGVPDRFEPFSNEELDAMIMELTNAPVMDPDDEYNVVRRRLVLEMNAVWKARMDANHTYLDGWPGLNI